MKIHPRCDDQGKPVRLDSPSVATPLSSWHTPDELATVVPDGPLPTELNGVPFPAWADAPQSEAGWKAIVRSPEGEPPFVAPAGLRRAAGVVVLEPCGRVWVVSPSNRFGDYDNTFPKGSVEKGTSLWATAVKEAFEESGLQVEVTRFLVDCRRSMSYTRYYLARRVGGDPSQMGWESQAVHLVPRAQLAAFVTSPYDKPVLAALQQRFDRESDTSIRSR